AGRAGRTPHGGKQRGQGDKGMARRWLTRSWPNMSRSLDAFFETQGNAQGEEGRGPLADEDPPPVGPLGAALLLLPGHTPAQKSDSHTGGAGGVGHLRGDSEFGQLRDHGFPCGSTAVPLCLCPKTCQVKSRGEQNMRSCGAPNRDRTLLTVQVGVRVSG